MVLCWEGVSIGRGSLQGGEIEGCMGFSTEGVGVPRRVGVQVALRGGGLCREEREGEGTCFDLPFVD